MTDNPNLPEKLIRSLKASTANLRNIHLDRRAADLLTKIGDDDLVFNTQELAEYLNVSHQWLSLARRGGFGPPFMKIGTMVRYRLGDVRDWLRERVCIRTTKGRPHSAAVRQKMAATYKRRTQEAAQ
jgi:Helix-turn-helix domain